MVALRRVVRRLESFDSSSRLLVFELVLVRLRERLGFFLFLDGATTSFSLPLIGGKNCVNIEEKNVVFSPK